MRLSWMLWVPATLAPPLGRPYTGASHSRWRTALPLVCDCYCYSVWKQELSRREGPLFSCHPQKHFTPVLTIFYICVYILFLQANVLMSFYLQNNLMTKQGIVATSTKGTDKSILRRKIFHEKKIEQVQQRSLTLFLLFLTWLKMR